MPYVKNWRVAVDCGAHVGIFTRRMEERFEEVYAFEPQADNFRCLAQNTTKARLFNCLLWHQKDMLAMKLDDHPNTGAGEIDVAAKGRYLAVPLDNFGIYDAGLIKLDVQDAETAVLFGAEKSLNFNPVLIVENTGRDPRLAEVLGLLRYNQVAQVRRDGIWIRS